MYPKEYLDYLIYFHAERDYFECHEVLEEFWKKEGMKNQVWVGLIQISVALYHHRRDNFSGAIKMMNSSLKILQKEEEHLIRLGINQTKLYQLLENTLDSLRKHQPYQSINLPLHPRVLQECKKICEAKGWEWNRSSDLSNQDLIHKHTLRDRTDVINERLEQLKKR